MSFLMGMFFSLLIAIYLIFSPIAADSTINMNIFSLILIIVSTFFLFLYGITIALSFTSLQRVEESITPRLFSLLKKDKYILGIYSWIILFALFSYFLVADTLFFNLLPKNYLLAIWIFSFGIAIDVYYNLLKRIMSYLNPFDNILLFTQMAKESIQNDKELDLCEAIDSLTEISIKSIHKITPSLANQSLQELQTIVKNFLSSSKSISHIEADEQTKALGIKDRISYTLFYILDRIALINDEALSKNLEHTVATTITILGKITIHCAKFDLTLVNYPVHFISRNAQSAIQKNMDDIGIRASVTLIEVSKTIIDEVNYTYGDLKEPFFSITNALEEITKALFLKDKNTNLKILTQPFRDLKDLFNNPKVINHQDTPAILQNIDRVLDEYNSLELVMKTIPPIPET